MSFDIDYSKAKNTKHININGKDIFIVGTAHVLKDSKEEVEYVINQVEPDDVCVELCESRYKSIKQENKWKNLDIVKVLKKGQGFLLFASMALSAAQKKWGLELDSKPGAEMIQAIEIAEEKKINLSLIDRDVNTTFKRAWRTSKFKDKLSILGLLFESIFSKEEIEKEDINEMMQEKDLFNDMMQTFAKQLPSVKRTFIDERDTFLAHGIKKAKGNTIVAVIGKGHMNGIIEYLENDLEYNDEINTVPKKSSITKAFPYLITIIILGIFGYGFTQGKGVDMLLAWVFANGVFTSIAALIVLANPLTIILAWVVSPITSLNPTIGAGIVLGLIEAWIKKPKVHDFEALSEDVLTIKGLYKNRITKVLLVFVATSIGSTIGTFVGLPWITALLS